MTLYPIADLHCDLLAYLAGDAKHTAYRPESRCSIPQMQEGGVRWQTLAIYVTTNPNSVLEAQKQFSVFKSLLKTYPELKKLKEATQESIGIVAAIENASGFCGEGESLESGLARLSQMHQEAERILYISLTWNDENRFGGGNMTSIGLKEDGKQLLRYLNGKGIAVDFSHTSDPLAYDILNFIDKESLEIRVMASHSNFREICDVPRNLPDTIAKEILRREGVIGLNAIASFLGPNPPSSFMKQLEHGLKLGAEKALCLGADFFYDGDIPEQYRKPADAYFYPDYGDASTYQKILSVYKSLGVSEEQMRDLSSENYFRFFKMIDPSLKSFVSPNSALNF